MSAVCRTCGTLANEDQLGEPCPICSKKAGARAGLIVEFTADNLPKWKPHIDYKKEVHRTYEQELEIRVRHLEGAMREIIEHCEICNGYEPTPGMCVRCQYFQMLLDQTMSEAEVQADIARHTIEH